MAKLEGEGVGYTSGEGGGGGGCYVSGKGGGAWLCMGGMAG